MIIFFNHWFDFMRLYKYIFYVVSTYETYNDSTALISFRKIFYRLSIRALLKIVYNS